MNINEEFEEDGDIKDLDLTLKKKYTRIWN